MEPWSLLLLVFLAGYLVWRGFASRETDDPAPVNTRWHAISIRCGAEPCVGALNLRQRRFLSDSAPPLPLPHCDGRRCTCTYRHFDDRREGPRRSAMAGLATRQWGAEGQDERREQRDRRGPMTA